MTWHILALRKTTRFIAISLVPGLCVPIVLATISGIDTWILGNCEMKFGCAGGVVMYALLGGVGGLMICVGGALMAALFTSPIYTLPARWLAAASAAIGALGSCGTLILIHFPFEPFEVNLFVLLLGGAIATWGTLFTSQKLATPNYALERSRGAAS